MKIAIAMIITMIIIIGSFANLAKQEIENNTTKINAALALEKQYLHNKNQFQIEK